MMARPTRSQLLYAQMLGRGTRNYPTKEDCLIIDLVGNADAHDLVTVASLFDVKPPFLHGRTLTDAITAQEQADAAERTMPYAGRTLDMRAEEVRGLFSRKRLAWVPVDDDLFALSLTDGDCILLQCGSDERYAVQLINTRQLYRPAETLARGLTLEYAQGYAEDIVRRGNLGGLTNPYARFWKAPASEKTRNYASRLGLWLPEDVTQEQASHAITTALVQAWLERHGGCVA
jgi:hypothetical protein